MVGDVNTEEVAKTAQQLIHFEEHTAKTIDRRTKKNSRDVKEIKEAQDVKQGKLNIGFRTNVLYGDEDYYAIQVLTEYLADILTQSYLSMFEKKRALPIMLQVV